MSGLERAAAALVAAAAMLALVALSSVSVRAGDPRGASIRLSWRAVGERAEECREVSPEELAALPAHMRAPRICERRLLPFRLLVSLDGKQVLRERLQPAGASGDRPVYVDRELRVDPGRHRIELRFDVEWPPGVEARAPEPSFDRELDLGAGELQLVTLDSDTRRFVVRSRRGED